MARKSPYSRFDNHELTLRDVLAVDRTIVANERTFLGYVRTTLALLAAGGSLLHFMDAMWSTVTGMVLLAVSVPTFAIGLRHYIVRWRTLSPLMREVTAEAIPGAEPESGSTADTMHAISRGLEKKPAHELLR